MATRSSDMFLARQPIVDRQRRLVAYELLFRNGSDGNRARVDDDALATAGVVQRAFGDLGIRTVVGGARAFVNLDAEWLLGSAVQRLPGPQVVLEILETVCIDAQLVERCRVLKALGYLLALDDFFHYNEAYEPLLAVVDIVKIDVLQLDSAALGALVRRLQLWPTRLLAEKVDTAERAAQCMALGFDLFQGFFFGRPAILDA